MFKIRVASSDKTGGLTLTTRGSTVDVGTEVDPRVERVDIFSLAQAVDP